MQPLLSILIPTVVGREETFHRLKKFLEWQQWRDKNIGAQIEIISISDNKEISIGEKRNQLYKKSAGLFSWMIDDDDSVHYDAVRLIVNAIHNNPNADCIGFKELCIYNGKKVESSNFSLKYSEWGDNFDGFDHVRTPFHKTPINTKLCQAVGVKDLRYGEDHQFAKDIYPLLAVETYIDEFIYIYRHNTEDHNKKYGIVE